MAVKFCKSRLITIDCSQPDSRVNFWTSKSVMHWYSLKWDQATSKEEEKAQRLTPATPANLWIFILQLAESAEVKEQRWLDKLQTMRRQKLEANPDYFNRLLTMNADSPSRDWTMNFELLMICSLILRYFHILVTHLVLRPCLIEAIVHGRRKLKASKDKASQSQGLI